MSKGNFNRGCIGGSNSITTYPGAYKNGNDYRGSPIEHPGGRGPSPVDTRLNVLEGLERLPLALRLLLIAGLIGGGYGNIIGKLFEGGRDDGGTYVKSQNNCGPVITAARVGIEAVEAVQ